MNIVKKIARWILQKELDEEKQKQKFEINNLIISKRVLISQTMLECISKILPDSNQMGAEKMTSEDFRIHSIYFTDGINGIRHKIFIKDIDCKKGVNIYISDYEINIFIPLCRENINYKICGIDSSIDSSIDTYFWDFYKAGIRMVSDEAWGVSVEFMMAQRNVLKEFKEEGLL